MGRTNMMLILVLAWEGYGLFDDFVELQLSKGYIGQLLNLGDFDVNI